MVITLEEKRIQSFEGETRLDIEDGGMKIVASCTKAKSKFQRSISLAPNAMVLGKYVFTGDAGEHPNCFKVRVVLETANTEANSRLVEFSVGDRLIVEIA